MRSILPALALVSALTAAEPITSKIDLFDVIKAGDVEHHINPTMDLHDAPKDIWTFQPDGSLKVSGRGYGYIATKRDYADYHLVLEFKWGEKTWGAREKKARDNGLLLHAYGPHGAYSNTWMASIECQIIEGGVGDILVLSPTPELQTSVTSEFTLDRDKEKVWSPGSPKQVVTKGRINWQHRDPDWTDTRGYRGPREVENALGEWNRLEVMAKADTLTYLLNGVKVNECFNCKPASGRILLQTEGAEMHVRRYELHPLGSFTEKWSAIQGSGGTDIDVRIDAQDHALSPEESLKRIQLDGPYEAQLVACEPLVLDPVECTWDEHGRLFVAEMIDYPLGPKNPGDPWLSRIQQLIDDNADGRMDRAITFAANLDHVNGLLPYNGGLIATTRTQVLFLKDTDGDGKADVNEPLIKGFNPRHAQLQVSSPRWGLDNCVHFNNGLDAKEIYPVTDPAQTLPDGAIPNHKSEIINHKSTTVARSNFKWSPQTGEITPTGGPGQFGGAFDDWGHHFYCSNRNPIMFTVMPYEVMARNPHAGITENWENIAPYGADTRVYPLQITHTTADAHAGTNTACCGLGVYRGPLMPELKNNVFVPDPTGQLITRYKIEPNGASLKATRVGERTEFFRSSDEWCRPVNFTTGPDGAIYVCDIYRRWIDHARFFPEEFVKKNDMRQGEHEGRIWRIVPKGRQRSTGVPPVPSAAPQAVAGVLDPGPDAQRSREPTGWPGLGPSPSRKGSPSPPGSQTQATTVPQKLEDLVAMLGHDNAWQRETAQRLLVDKSRIERKLAEQVAQVVAPIAESEDLGVFGKAHARAILEMIGDYYKLTTDVFAPDYNLAVGRNDPPHLGERTPYLPMDSSNPDTSASAFAKGLQRAASDFVCFCGQDSTGGLVEAILQGSTDRWVKAAVLSGMERNAGKIVSLALTAPRRIRIHNRDSKPLADLPSAEAADFIRRGASICATTANVADIMELTHSLLLEPLKPGQLTWWKPALLQGLAEGLPRSGGKLGVKSLAEFIAKPPANFEAAAKEITALMAQIETTALDPKAPLDTRLAVLPLLAQSKWDKVQPIIADLLQPTQPAALADGALALLKKFRITDTAPFLYAHMNSASPALKQQFVTMLAANPATALDLLKRMERGELPKALIDIERRWSMQRGKGELHDLAVKLFGQPSEDRAKVLASYADSAKKLGDATRGKAVFQTICIACHKVGDLGMEVGPPLSDVKVKLPEALLSDILDPNRMFEARWSATQIDTHDGRTLSGLVTAESPDVVTLTMMGGVKEPVPRTAIKAMKSLDRSLMPVGLEAGISPEQMSDLLAFLLGK